MAIIYPIELRFEGQVRGGKNHIGITKKGHRFPLKTFANWVRSVRHDIEVQYRLHNFRFPQVKPMKVSILYVPGDRKRRDIPAILDAIFHVMEKAGVVKDDCLLEDIEFKTFPIQAGAGYARVLLWRKDVL